MTDKTEKVSAGARLEEHVLQLLSLIDRAYADLAQSRQPQDAANALPEAADELNAVIAEISAAIEKIMDAADVFNEIAEQLPAPLSEKATLAASTIYESCAFQDITGQRIFKIIRLLQAVTDRIHYIVSELSPSTTPNASLKQAVPLSREAALMNGPGLPGVAKTQAEIDALLHGSES